MKLYDGGKAPNPRRVRIYLAEKGTDVPLVPVDMAAMEHRSAGATARNPLQQLPVLEFDERFHEACADRNPGKLRQRPPMARRPEGAPECRGVI